MIDELRFLIFEVGEEEDGTSGAENGGQWGGACAAVSLAFPFAADGDVGAPGGE